MSSAESLLSFYSHLLPPLHASLISTASLCAFSCMPSSAWKPVLLHSFWKIPKTGETGGNSHGIGICMCSSFYTWCCLLVDGCACLGLPSRWLWFLHFFFTSTLCLTHFHWKRGSGHACVHFVPVVAGDICAVAFGGNLPLHSLAGDVLLTHSFVVASSGTFPDPEGRCCFS